MSDDIRGTERIKLRPGAIAAPYTITVTVCTSATANDGWIPYGTNVDSVVITSYKKVSGAANTLVTDLINSTHTYSITSNVITIYLDYPGTSGPGSYELKILPTLDNSKTVDSFLIQGIVAENLQAA